MGESTLEIFSQEWAEALGRALNASPDYREAAARWEGSLVFALRGADHSTGSAVFLDLWHGECRAARRADAGDVEGADFLLRADSDTWQRLLGGQIDALFAVMTGKLELARGSLVQLMPHATAAKQLVTTASELGGTLPGA